MNHLRETFTHIDPLPKQNAKNKRGFFGIGVENLSKPHNAGSLYRTAHAFHADFIFAIAPTVEVRKILKVDTSRAARHVPFYAYETIKDLNKPLNSKIIGVELMSGAEDLPDFIHPDQAVYIMGPEKGSLSPDIVEKCDFLVKIPTKFCVNVGTAGAILLYDRYMKKMRQK